MDECQYFRRKWGVKLDEKVRLINYDELDKLLLLYRYLNPEDPDISGKDETTALWEKIFNDPHQHVFVIEEDGQIVASCTLVTVNNLTRGGSPYGLVENVVTHGNYRKRGYGKAVLKKAVEAARSIGCYKVMLLTGRKDEGTLTFYENAGFTRGMKTGFCIKF